MSITRAFTTRRVKQSIMAAEAESLPQRSNTTKAPVRSIRHKISAPVELIHTTNMLSYNAPDIYPKTATSTSSSNRSDDDLSDSAPTTASSPPTSPDVETPPQRSLSPEPNHLSCYFTPPQTHAISPVRETAAEAAPVIPQRALSHTKRSYDPLPRKRSDAIPRQRSVSRMSEQSQRTVSTKASFSYSRSSSGSTSTAATSQHSSTSPYHKAKVSTASFSSTPPTAALPTPPTPTSQSHSHSLSHSQSHSQLHRKDFSQSHHPFGQELAQVTEIAEEYGVKEKLNELDSEEKEMLARGLYKFAASDYLSEIQNLEASIFNLVKPAATTVWI